MPHALNPVAKNPAQNIEPFSSPGLAFCVAEGVAALEVELELLEPLLAEAAFTGPTIPPWALNVGAVVLETLAAAALNSARVFELSELQNRVSCAASMGSRSARGRREIR